MVPVTPVPLLPRLPRLALDRECRRVLDLARASGSLALEDLDRLIERPEFFSRKIGPFLGNLAAIDPRILVGPARAEHLVSFGPGPGVPTARPKDPVRYYLHEVARIPRLRKAGEIRIAQQLEFLRARVLHVLRGLGAAGVRCVSVGKDMPSREPAFRLRLAGKPLDEPSIRAHGLEGALDRLRRCLLDFKALRDEFVQRNLYLVIETSGRYRHLGVLHWDLIQEGNLGLMKAVERYEWRKNLRFATYASWWIAQAMVRGCLNNIRTIRVPLYVYKKLNEVRNRAATLGPEARNGTAGSEAVWAASNVPPQKIDLFLSVDRFIYSINQLVPDGDQPLEDLIEDGRAEDPLARLESQAVHEGIRSVLASLDARERRIVELRFGIESSGSHTLEEVSRCFGISRERVRQIQKQALEKLKNLAACRGLEDPQGPKAPDDGAIRPTSDDDDGPSGRILVPVRLATTA